MAPAWLPSRFGFVATHPEVSIAATAALWVSASLAACAIEPPPASKAIGIVDAVETIDPTIRPPKRFALVVGVADYQDARITDLPACERDARDLAALLRDPANGLFPAEHVTLLTNDAVTRTAVVAALDELARKAGPQDLVVVFFSGHGATDEKGRAYWVMHDTKATALRSTALPELEITELLGEIRTNRLVTIIDACYSAATAAVGATKSLPDLRTIYPDFKGDGRVGMTASKGDQLSMVINDEQDPGFGHSAFTYHVIEGLRGNADARGNGDGVIELDELWSYVKDRTIETARRQGGNQEPQLKGQVGSRFMLAIDGERLRALAESRRDASSRSTTQLAALQDLFVREALTAAQFDEARTLLRTPMSALDEPGRRKRELYADLAEGRLAPTQIAALLGGVESTPAATDGASSGGSAGLPITHAAWSEIIASLAPRFPDVEAPVAIALDLDALRADDRWQRFAEASAGWADLDWSTARGGLPRQAVLFGEPLPATSDSTFLLRGMVRQHRGEGPLGAYFDHSIITDIGSERAGGAGGTTTLMVAPRSTLTLVGESGAVDRLLGRPTDARPTFTAGLRSLLRSSMPLGAVADGPWALAQLERFARSRGSGQRGGIFVGSVFESLSLPDSSGLAEAWTDATAGLQAVSLQGQPTGPWIRTTLRLDFGTAAEADHAAPGWRLFLSRLPEWSAEAVRPLDVQCSERSLLLRLDVRGDAAIAWIDSHLALPGSALTRP